MNWKVYNEFAWTEHILANPESYEEEGEYKLKVFIGNIMV